MSVEFSELADGTAHCHLHTVKCHPVQDAAIAALTGPQDGVKRQQEEYAARNHALCQGLRDIGWEVPDSQGTMFVWAPIPGSYDSSEKFTMDLMERSGVIVTPGSAFGDLGEGYVRMALVLDVPTIRKVVEAIRECKILE